MIAKLKGVVDSISDGFAVIDVHGVGYLVFCSAKTLTALPKKGEAAALFIETHVREDHIHLYGFGSEEEKKWFLLLTKVQGVGAKVALAILSIMTPDKVAEAIVSADKALIAQADGVGPKIALRVITELKDKLEVQSYVKLVVPKFLEAKDGEVKSLAEDAVSALINLGYQRADAYAKVAKILASTQETITVADLIRKSLKEFGNKG